jgi:hypothetical protein
MTNDGAAHAAPTDVAASSSAAHSSLTVLFLGFMFHLPLQIVFSEYITPLVENFRVTSADKASGVQFP